MFNSILVNYYKTGKSGINFHADDEPSIIPGSKIASLSIGAVRTFDIVHKQGGPMTSLQLPSGSLLVMGNSCQKYFKHRIRPEPHITGSRINLTFRQLHL